MSLSKAVIISSILMAVFLIGFSQQIGFGKITQKTNLQFTGDSTIGLDAKNINGFMVSGSFDGPGHAKGWIVTDQSKKLAFDTRQLKSSGVFSTNKFKNACLQSCEFPKETAQELQIEIRGGGTLTLNEYTFTKAQNAIGLALCPNCKKVSTRGEPNHSLLVIVILLALTILGTHTLSHFCKVKKAKLAMLIVFITSFIVLIGMFGLTITMPTAAISVYARRGSSILAALGVLSVFGILAYELVKRNHTSQDYEGDKWE